MPNAVVKLIYSRTLEICYLKYQVYFKRVYEEASKVFDQSNLVVWG